MRIVISVDGLVKRYEGKNSKKTAVTGLAFEVPEGKLFTLLGPSGCGKTTTLRMIAGLERPSGGTMRIDGASVFDEATRTFVPAHRRPIGMVFQSYAIWPHMSVVENVSFPLTVGTRRPTRAAAKRRALEALDLVGLADLGDRPATMLSGGQQQRVALARALVREPKVLLLDEPLSNLDAQLRERMRSEIRSVQQTLGITAVYVTHDQNEALAISDLIMLMDQGAIVETGAPQQIYRRPQTEFTANFIGVANAVDGTVVASDASGLIVQTPQGLLRSEASPDLRPGDGVRAFVRPESIALARKRHADDDWSGSIRYSIYQGECWDHTVDVNGVDVRVRIHREKEGLGHGDVVYLRPDPTETLVMPLRDGIVARVAPSPLLSVPTFDQGALATPRTDSEERTTS